MLFLCYCYLGVYLETILEAFVGSPHILNLRCDGWTATDDEEQMPKKYQSPVEFGPFRPLFFL